MPGSLITEAVKWGDGITVTARQWLSAISDGVLVEVAGEC